MSEILAMIANAKEFDQLKVYNIILYLYVLACKYNLVLNCFLKVRDEEVIELESLAHKYCHVEYNSSAVNVNGKVNILLQTYLARGRAKGFSLISDLVYISQVNLKLNLIINK